MDETDSCGIQTFKSESHIFVYQDIGTVQTLTRLQFGVTFANLQRNESNKTKKLNPKETLLWALESIKRIDWSCLTAVSTLGLDKG